MWMSNPGWSNNWWRQFIRSIYPLNWFPLRWLFHNDIIGSKIHQVNLPFKLISTLVMMSHHTLLIDCPKVTTNTTHFHEILFCLRANFKLLPWPILFPFFLVLLLLEWHTSMKFNSMAYSISQLFRSWPWKHLHADSVIVRIPQFRMGSQIWIDLKFIWMPSEELEF